MEGWKNLSNGLINLANLLLVVFLLNAYLKNVNLGIDIIIITITIIVQFYIMGVIIGNDLAKKDDK